MNPEDQAQVDSPAQMSSSIVHDGNPYFMSDQALIKFSSAEGGFGPETYWLVDKKDKTIRAFESHMALDEAFGEELETALKNVVTVSDPIVDQNMDITEGVLKDFQILGPEYAIKDDATAKPMEFSSSQLKNRYGKPVDEDKENRAMDHLDTLFDSFSQENPDVPQDFIEDLKQNSQLMAFYISSLAYGGYGLEEVTSDIQNRYTNNKDQ